MVVDDDVTQEDLLQQLEQNLSHEDDDDSSTIPPAFKGSNTRRVKTKLLPSDCRYGVLRKINSGANNECDISSTQGQASFEGSCVKRKKLSNKGITDDADSLKKVLKRKLKPESNSSSCNVLNGFKHNFTGKSRKHTDVLKGDSCLCKSTSDYSLQFSKNKNTKLSKSLVCLHGKTNNGQSLEKLLPSVSTKQNKNKRKRDSLNTSTGTTKKLKLQKSRGNSQSSSGDEEKCSVGGHDKQMSPSGDCVLNDPSRPTGLVEQKDCPIIPSQLFDTTDTSVEKQELDICFSPSR